MSTKVKKKTYVITDGDMSSDISSAVQENFEVMHTTIYMWWTGTSPVGTIKVMARVNPEKEKTGVFKELVLSSALNVSGDTGSFVATLTEPVGQWYLLYTATSGVGTLNATWEGRSE